MYIYAALASDNGHSARNTCHFRSFAQWNKEVLTWGRTDHVSNILDDHKFSAGSYYLQFPIQVFVLVLGLHSYKFVLAMITLLTRFESLASHIPKIW